MTSSWVDPKWGFTGYKWGLSCVQILSDWECWRRCLFHGKIQDTSPPVLVFMYAPKSHPHAKFISFWSDFTVSICNAQTPNQISDYKHENYLNEWKQGTDEPEGGTSKYVEPFWHWWLLGMLTFRHYFNSDFFEC